jgi:hypothetical protein
MPAGDGDPSIPARVRGFYDFEGSVGAKGLGGRVSERRFRIANASPKALELHRERFKRWEKEMAQMAMK